MEKIVLNGKNLKIEDVWRITHDPEVKVSIPQVALKAVRASYEFTNRDWGGRIIYGVNTGFGPMASHIIPPPSRQDLGRNRR